MRDIGRGSAGSGCLLAVASAALALAACSSSSSKTDAARDGGPGDDGSVDGAPDGLHWYETCGLPVCPTGDAGPTFDAGVAACTVEKAGEACATAGATCDPGVGCDVLLECAAKDPRVQPGGCPISRRSAKLGIDYLDDAARAKLAAQIRALRLATYRYKDAPARTRLGFVIDDAPGLPAVDAPRDQIDLYGYLSMAVGALQVEMARVDADEREIAALRARLDTLAGPRRGARAGRSVSPPPPRRPSDPLSSGDPSPK